MYTQVSYYLDWIMANRGWSTIIRYIEQNVNNFPFLLFKSSMCENTDYTNELAYSMK